MIYLLFSQPQSGANLLILFGSCLQGVGGRIHGILVKHSRPAAVLGRMIVVMLHPVGDQFLRFFSKRQLQVYIVVPMKMSQFHSSFVDRSLACIA